MAGHLARVLDALAAADIDALVLGRPDNARFVSGADGLTLAGTRPWGPGCVVVRATAAVHLLATSDAGVPADVPFDHLYPTRWNPVNLLAALAAIDALAAARRIGVDGISPLFEQLLPTVVPEAELVDGEAVLRAVRRVKDPADLDGIAAAANVARDAFAALAATIEPDAPVWTLRAAFLARMCGHGVTTPSFDPRVRVAGRLLDRDDVLPSGLVSVEAGVVRDGYEASLGRTIACGDVADAAERLAAWRARRDEVVGLLGGVATVGEARALPGVAAEGIGIGYERLVDDDPLEPGMVLGVVVRDDGVDGRDVVALRSSGPELLTA